MVASETGELGAAQRPVPADQQHRHVAYPRDGGGVDRQQDLEEVRCSPMGGLYSSSDSLIDDLGRQAFAVGRQAQGQVPEVVVDPAVPILYFGDVNAYFESSLMVVTVGLNPSREEFPRGAPFRRFPRARGLTGYMSDRYLGALGEYFRADPYRSWFGTFEPLLNGMGASYYPGEDSTAIHTDLCSPVATDPTWTGLDRAQRQALISSGRPLWHDLIRALRPEVMLISVARHHLRGIAFPRVTEPSELYRIDRSRPYITQAWTIKIDESHHTMVVFGQAAQRPFGTVGKVDKVAMGRRIAEVVHE